MVYVYVRLVLHIPVGRNEFTLCYVLDLRTVLYVLLLLHATSSLYECYILELLTVLCYRFMRVFLFIHTLDYMFFVVNLFFFS